MYKRAASGGFLVDENICYSGCFEKSSVGEKRMPLHHLLRKAQKINSLHWDPGKFPDRLPFYR
jgi:hypothetical protein